MEIENYLRKLLPNIQIKPVDIKISIPLLMKNLYNIKCLEIYDVKVIFLELKDNKINLISYKKHKEIIEKKYDYNCLLVANVLIARQINTLIRNNFMFIIPEKQMFLPFLGIVLQKQRELSNIQIKFTPQTQICALYIFYNFRDGEFMVDDIASKTGLNEMAISRGLGILTKLNVISYKKNGVLKKYFPNISKKQYYIMIKKYFINPVAKTIYGIEDKNTLLKSGISALSKMTMITDNAYKTYAITKGDDRGISDIEYLDDNYCLFEIWKYNPLIFARNNCVDPISLIASLKNNNDERIQKEINKLEEEILSDHYYSKWFGEF